MTSNFAAQPKAQGANALWSSRVIPERHLPVSSGIHPRLRWSWLIGSGLALLCALLIFNPNYSWSTHRLVPFGADFVQEWVAGDMLLHGAGATIYDQSAFANWQHDASRLGFHWPTQDYYPAVYPPPYYCLVAPLACLPYRVATVVWLLLMIAAYLGAVGLIERTPWPAGVTENLSRSGLTVAWCAALLLPAMFAGCVMGQKGSCWFLIAVGSWQLWRSERSFAAGCLCALLTLKPTLCCVLPLVMVMNRQWRFCAGLIVGAIGLWGTTALMVPTNLWADYIQVVRGTAQYQSHAGYRSGWSTSLLTLLSATGLPRAAVIIGWLVAATTLLWSLWITPRRWSAADKLHDPEFLFRALAGTALLSPHFYFYDLIWLLFPLRGMFNAAPYRALCYLAILWICMLVSQQFEQGWPIVSCALLVLLIHATLDRMTCGILFAFCNHHGRSGVTCSWSSRVSRKLADSRPVS